MTINGRASRERLGELRRAHSPNPQRFERKANPCLSTQLEQHMTYLQTFVIEYDSADDAPPVHADMKALNGTVVGVMFGDALAEAERLQNILDSRPAINAGLPETYVKWSQSVYADDAAQAVRNVPNAMN